MKSGKLIKLAAINLLPTVLLLFQTSELYETLAGNIDYPFGSDFFSTFSIYHSKARFIGYTITCIASLFILICLSFRNKRQAYFFMLCLTVVILLYPMFSNT